jgi:hypothetical protein
MVGWPGWGWVSLDTLTQPTASNRCPTGAQPGVDLHRYRLEITRPTDPTNRVPNRLPNRMLIFKQEEENDYDSIRDRDHD